VHSNHDPEESAYLGHDYLQSYALPERHKPLNFNP
jgi:hypothetical protein